MNHSILAQHAQRLRKLSLKELAENRLDTSNFSVTGWSVNIARQKIDHEAEQALIQYGKTIDLENAVRSLFNGDVVNRSENRPALHWALRCPEPSFTGARQVRDSLIAPFTFAEAVRDGRVLSSSGKRFESILHIGIGGSDLGPRLLYDAFYKERDRRFELRFCANVDPLDFELATDGLNPKTTLVIGVSKSFQTEETSYNLKRARRWLESSAEGDWSNNVAVVTSKHNLAEHWLERSDGNIFAIPESVGGRYSIWSAGSLSCYIALGKDLINEILRGAESTDQRVRGDPIESNVAMRLALLDYWNASVLNYPMRVELAYSRRLRLLPSYLQQLEMESNGKSVRSDGTAAGSPTTQAVWGGEGTIGQHSYHQWLHQSTQIAPCEFLIALDNDGEFEGQSNLIANALAQAEVLAEGRSSDHVKNEGHEQSNELSKQKELTGERPSTFIMNKQFSPWGFGSLIALFEHRTYLAGQLWGLNSFDQWGVEEGKQMAEQLKPVVHGTRIAENLITRRLVGTIMKTHTRS